MAARQFAVSAVVPCVSERIIHKSNRSPNGRWPEPDLSAELARLDSATGLQA